MKYDLSLDTLINSVGGKFYKYPPLDKLPYETGFFDYDFLDESDTPELDEYDNIQAIRAYEAKVEIQSLKETIALSPARPYVALITNAGYNKGTVNYLTPKQYQVLTGAKWVTQKADFNGKQVIRKVLMGGEHAGSGTKDKQGRICWEYTLDEKAEDLGYKGAGLLCSREEFREAIHGVKAMQDKVKELQKRT